MLKYKRTLFALFTLVNVIGAGWYCARLDYETEVTRDELCHAFGPHYRKADMIKELTYPHRGYVKSEDCHIARRPVAAPAVGALFGAVLAGLFSAVLFLLRQLFSFTLREDRADLIATTKKEHAAGQISHPGH